MLINGQPKSKKAAFFPHLPTSWGTGSLPRAPGRARAPSPESAGWDKCGLIMLLSIILTSMSRLEQIHPCELGHIIIEIHIF